MHLPRSFVLKLTRSAGLCLTMLASLTLVDNVVLAQTSATPKVNPATGSPAQGVEHPRPPRPIDSPYAKAAFAALHAPLDKLTPVTDEMLRNPPPGDWLNWRRTYNGWGYSPLKQIDRDNVKNLKVAWTFSMDSSPDAVTETTPLVLQRRHVPLELRRND